MEEIAQLYNTAMDKPLRILSIFNEFFDEERVDMQGFPSLEEVVHALPATADLHAVERYIDQYSRYVPFILVHFPHITITNEYDRSTDITHLYAKIELHRDGTMENRFTLNRSEYSTLHFINNYMHSHVSSIPIYDFSEFQTPCTGSGPINRTISSLIAQFDEDLWRLFCLELDRFVRVESIQGTPYHRLESLTYAGRRSVDYRVYEDVGIQNNPGLSRAITSILSPVKVAEFIKFVIDSKKIKFTYQGGRFVLAMSPTSYYITLSNLFIEWFNKKVIRGEVAHILVSDLIAAQILGKYTMVNGRIIRKSNHNLDPTTANGAFICTFKGQDVRVSISDLQDESENENSILILDRCFSEYVVTKLLNVINYKYGNNRSDEASANKEIYFV